MLESKKNPDHQIISLNFFTKDVFSNSNPSSPVSSSVGTFWKSAQYENTKQDQQQSRTETKSSSARGSYEKEMRQRRSR